jgi:hypothetical protein
MPLATDADELSEVAVLCADGPVRNLTGPLRVPGEQRRPAVQAGPIRDGFLCALPQTARFSMICRRTG